MDVDVTVYWRPGCGFCSMLRHKLKRSDLTYREVDIWSDPSAAAIVRSYANGNETVPTVVIGEPGQVRAQVTLVEHLGHETLVHLRIGESPLVARVEALPGAAGVPTVGADVGVAFPAAHLHRFDPATHERVDG